MMFSAPLIAETGFQNRPIINNLGMNTGHTLNKGEFIIGIGPIGYGISDKVQVGSNVLLFLFANYNVGIKTCLFENNNNAFALGVDLAQFYTTSKGRTNAFVSRSPYISYTTRIGEATNLHLGGRFSFITNDDKLDDSQKKAMALGTSLAAGIDYSSSNKTKFLAELGYDFTFERYRLGGGVLWGWKTFRLKLGLNYFSAKDKDNGYIFPVLGLWWRF